MAENKGKLFSEFPPVSTEQWMEVITKDLKGADFEKKLVWKTNEGFKVQPFYRQEDLNGLESIDSLPGEFPFVRGTKADNHWLVRQDIEVENPQTANAKALDVLNKGVDSLCFVFGGKDFTAEDMAALLKGIYLECIEINFRNCNKQVLNIFKLFVEYLKANNINLENVKGSINFDPFKRPLTKGMEAGEWIENATELLQLAEALPHFRVLGANPVMFNNAGCYIAQELGFGLAYGQAYLDALTEKGFDACAVAKRIKFNFGISTNYFMEIAKFRAARMLWAKIVKAYGVECDCACKIKMHATTSEWNMCIFDAYVNMLRTQTESMSAAIAGVDSLTVLPYDKVFAKANDFSERIARNQQLLLKEESHIEKIVDAAAGSYYIENLTAAIAEEAWKYFLTIQEKGGFYAAIKEGYIQGEVNASSEKRQTYIAQRREILLGNNQYPNITEIAEAQELAKSCGCKGTCSEEKPFATINFTRGAAKFEALRFATQANGKRPKVFMLTIGNLAMRLARAQFSTNFFGCAGYEIVDNLGFQTPEEGIEAALKAAADIVVICSSDDEYAELAPRAYKALDGKAIFVVAGAPACMEDLKAAGIENFIHVRSNVLESLQAFNQQLNIK
ncbi:MAG: methylmalonyl-CoA mutase small subunit [Bacteroidales bacterium]|nr:methylmalonyl-CoA mutase small subunit [Bacteroidales bacterium]